MPPGDARVDDGDADAGAGQAHRLVDGERADAERRPVVELGGGPIEMDAEDRGVRGKPRQQPVRNIDDVTVDDVELAGREPLEPRRKVRARFERHDRMRLPERVVVKGPERELLVQPVGLGVRVRRRGPGPVCRDGGAGRRRRRSTPTRG